MISTRDPRWPEYILRLADAVEKTAKRREAETATLPPEQELATAEEVLEQAARVKDHWPFCEFLNQCEAEVIVFQTLKACELNVRENRGCFSFKGRGVEDSAPLQGVDNAEGVHICKREKLLVEVVLDIEYAGKDIYRKDGKPVAFVFTKHGIGQIKAHLDKSMVKKRARK